MVKGFKKNDGKGGHKFIPTDNKPTKGNSKKSPDNSDGSTGLTRDELNKADPVKKGSGSISAEIKECAEKHVGSEITDNPYGNSYEFENGEQWLIFDNEKDAEEEAKESLQNLYDDMGTEAWREGYAESYQTISETDARLFGNDFGDMMVDGQDLDDLKRLADDYGIEYDDPDDIEDEDAKEKAEEKLEAKLIDEVSYERSEEVEKTILRNGLKSFICDDEGLCSEDEFQEQYGKWLHTDVDKLIQDSIDEDGIAHTLASYDGEEIELGNGAVMYRTD